MPDATTGLMRCVSLLSTASDAIDAGREIGAAAPGGTYDLAVLFISRQHQPHASRIVEFIRNHYDIRNLIGCTAESIIGADRELEDTPGVSLWLAQMPGVRVLPFVVDQQDLARLETPEDWFDRVGVKPGDRPHFMLLPEPFSIDSYQCLGGLSSAFPESMIVGGMASAASERGDNRLFVNDQVLGSGAVGVSLSGAVTVRSVVSQGCRPIGRTYVITKAQHNIIEQLGGKPVDEALKETYAAATPLEQQMIAQGLHVGRVVDEQLREFGQGDFLIRNITGFAPMRGMAIADRVRAGQTIQFHVRDPLAASEEFRSLLEKETRRWTSPPAGGIVFSCNGRGSRLFGQPNHDVGLVKCFFPSCPVTGFFAQGEIGPVGRRVFVHGFTCCVMLLGQP